MIHLYCGILYHINVKEPPVLQSPAAYIQLGGEFVNKPDCLLVMHEGLLQFSLLLQDTGQIRVGCCKFWENLRFKKKEKTRV